MKLNQALKKKNRLAGEIARLKDILMRENARRSDSVSKVDRADVLSNILRLSEELGVLKGKIAKANVGLYEWLERMSEYKSLICFFRGLPKREGEEVVFFNRDQERVYMWDSLINEEQADTQTVTYQKKIDELQDKIDQYNATTDI